MLNYWPLCDFVPSTEHFFLLFDVISPLCSYIIFWWHYAVLEMYYDMFAPIYFQVWPIFRLRIGIFAELLAILWFSPLHREFFTLGTYFPLFDAIKKYLDTIQCLEYIRKCLYQLVFRFGQFLDFKFTYLMNYWRFYNFDHTKWYFSSSHILFSSLWGYIYIFTLTLECLKCIIKCLIQFSFKFVQFLDSKLTYLSNYWRFCDFDPIYSWFLENFISIG